MNGDFRQARGEAVQLEKVGYNSDYFGLEGFERVGLDGQPLDILAAGNPNASLFIPIRAHYDGGVLHPVILQRTAYLTMSRSLMTRLPSTSV